MAGSTDYIVMLLTGDDTETDRSGCKNLPSGYDFLVENESLLKFGNPKKLAHQKIIILVVMLGHTGWGNVTQPVGTDLNKPLLACIRIRMNQARFYGACQSLCAVGTLSVAKNKLLSYGS